MKKAILVFSILLLAILALVSADQAKPEILKGKISIFSAEDMPNDDGAGIILKWKPLDKSHRVISYNIYRGVSPDSLFLISSVEVDPKLGVLAPELFFYDRGDQPIIEFETAPLKLKREKQQLAGSPLFRHFPQNAKLLGSLIGRYNITGAVSNTKLYHKSKPIKVNDNILAGLKLNRFEYLFAFPIPDQEYYYTVVAVNERGRLLPQADIQKVIPIDNEPANNATLFSTYIADTGVVNFEWNPPASSPDIATWDGWLMPKNLIPANGELLPENWQNSSTQLFQIPHYYGPVTCYHSVDTKAEGIKLPANLQDYTAVLAYSDYSGQASAVTARSFRILESKSLPRIPAFVVEDKQNDKGDYLVVSIGKPIAYVISATFVNNARKAIRINYELAANQHYKVDKLRFDVFAKDGSKIGQKTEHFLDKTILLKLPKKYHGTEDIRVRIALETKGSNVFDADYTEQHIVYDTNNKLFKGDEIFYRGEPISDLFFDILTHNSFEPDFMFGNRTNGISRAYDHSIPYESVLYQSILGYDAKSNRLTLDPQVTIDRDAESGNSFVIPLFKDKFAAGLKEQEVELARLKAQQAKFTEGSVPDSISQAIQDAESSLKFITQHPAYIQAQKAGNNKKWLNTLLKTHALNGRSYTYRLLKTDGEGAFVISGTYANEQGIVRFLPESEWFDTTKVITLIGTILLCVLLVYAIYITRRKEVYIRPIAGLHEIDNAIGSATEMGRPIMFVPGWGTLGEPSTIAAMMILGQVAKKAAEYDIRLISPHCDYMVLPLAQEMVQTSFSEVGRPDAYNQNDIFFISYDQFPFCAGVNGITVRERVATIFYMGFFNAEALLLTETGNQAGAVQIAGIDSVTQIPFFITTCDYTLIGEEFYAASAYLSRNHELVSMLKAQDYFKLVMVFFIILGTILSTLNLTWLVNVFPVE